MSPDGPPFTESELADIERWAHEDLRGTLGQQANARRLLRLVGELRWFRARFARLYHAIPDVPGTEKLQAELEREGHEAGCHEAGPPRLSQGTGRGAHP